MRIGFRRLIPVATFLNGAVNRAERRQQSRSRLDHLSQENRSSTLYSNEPGFTRELEMPDGVTIEAVLPQAEEGTDPSLPRRILFSGRHRAAASAIQLANRRDAHAPDCASRPHDRLSARGKRRCQ